MSSLWWTLIRSRLPSLEERRERLQPVMDNVSKEIKEYGTVKTLLPEADALERATTYRDKKIKPLFTQVKNKIAAMAAQVKELAKEVEKWRHKYQTGELTAHLNRVDQEAREQVETLVKQIEEKQGVTEQLKMQDLMKWGGLINNIKACAEEIVLKESVYM